MSQRLKNILGFTMIFLLLAGAAYAKPERSGTAVGTLITKIGSGSIVNKGVKYLFKDIKRGELVFAGEVIKTRENSRAQILMNDGSFVRLNHNTTLELKQKGKKKTNRLKLLIGNLWAKVKKRDSGLEIETPSAVAAIKGTELEVEVLKSLLAKLLVWDGLVLWLNDQGQQNVGAGYQSDAEKGQAPSEPKKFDMGQRDQWFKGVVDDPTTKTLKTKIRDKSGKEHDVNVKYKQK